MPLYQLFGGKARRAADVYVHSSGRDFQEVEDKARAFMEQGHRHIRCQVEVPGYSTYGSGGGRSTGPTIQPARRTARRWTRPTTD